MKYLRLNFLPKVVILFTLSSLLILISQKSSAQSQVQVVQLPTSSIAIANSINQGQNQSGTEELQLIAESLDDEENSFTKRSFFKIDLSAIPANAIIHSASLYLTGILHSPVNEVSGIITYPQGSWEASELNWDNQPEVPIENYAEISSVTSSDQDAIIDLTARIRELFYFPETYTDNGYCLRLIEENSNQLLSYNSENASNSTLQPYIEVTYEVALDLTYHFSSQPMRQNETNNGAIGIAISQGNPPYNYQWSDGTNNIGNGSRLSGLESGVYYLTVTDNINRTFTFVHSVGFDPEWKDDAIIQYSEFPNTIEKVSGYGWSEAVSSEAVLAAGQDGWIEYKVEELKHRMYGFAKPNDYQLGYTKIRAGIYLREDRNLRRVVNGVETSIGTYNIGDIIRIEKVGELFHFYLNGVLKNSYNYVGANQEDLILSATAFRPNSRLTNVITSFRRALEARVYVENETQNKTDGAIFVFPTFGKPPYSYNWSNAVGNIDRLTNLEAGIYTVTVTDALGATTVNTIDVLADPDYMKSWQSTRYYDESENLLGASKSFSDYNDKSTQSLSITTNNLNVFASQQLYDAYNRPAISTLSAPTFHDRLDFQSNFVKATDGQDYGIQHFDLEDEATVVPGQIHNPFGIQNTQKGTLGWYYSNNNTVEPYQDRTDHPYSRSVYSRYNPGLVVETSAPHDQFKMGSGHESKSYRIPASGELVYMFGYGGGWKVGKNYQITPNDPNSTIGGMGVIHTDLLEYEHKVFKQISYSPEGKESVTFIDSDGKLIATAMSGKNDDNVNEFEMNVSSFISGTCNDGYRFVDIHIAEGCENTLDLHDQYFDRLNYTFDIINLISGETVHSDLTTNFPTLSPGVYRIVDKMFQGQAYEGRTDIPSLKVKYKVNYYHFSLNYYDKKDQLVATVSPNDFDYNFSPGVTSEVKSGFQEFNYLSSNTDWEFMSNNLKKFSSNSITPSVGNEIQFTNVTLFLAPADQFVSMKNRGGGFEYSPSAVYEPEGGGNPESQPSSATYNYSSSESTYFSSGTERMQSGNGGGILVYEPGYYDCQGYGGTYFSSSSDANSTCIYGYQLLQSYVNGGVCVKCLPQNGCTNPPPHQGKVYLDFEVSAVTGSGNTVLSNFQIVASKITQTSVGGPVWQFDVGSNLGYNGAFNAAIAVVDQTLSKSTTSVEVKIVNLEYKYYQHANANGCDWTEMVYSTSGPSTTTLDNSGLNQLKLYYEFNTQKLGDFPDHQISETFQYNSVGELIRTKSVDAGESEFVYTQDGLLRFSQSAQQKVDQKFSYTNYDNKGRPLEMGIVDETAQPLKFQNHFIDRTLNPSDQTVLHPTTLEYIQALGDNSGVAISASATEDETYVRYDLPDAGITNLGAPFSNYIQNNVRGRVSHAWNDHTATWYSYQTNGRVDWMVTNHYNFLPKSIHYFYDAMGNVTNIIYQKDNVNDYFEHKYTYDRVGNLERAYTRTSYNGAFTEEAAYFYALDGSLKRVVIGQDLQGVDYTYNTLGMLKAINSPNLGVTNHLNYFVDPGRDGRSTKTDIFGMSFDYFAGDYSRGSTNVSSGTALNNSYEGQIAAVRWNTQLNQAASGQHIGYDYDYFKNGWLKSAFYTAVGPFGNSSTAPTTTTGAFGEYSVSGITYDKNGNLQALKRNGKSGNLNMDDFTYHYDPALPNRLTQLQDNPSFSGNYGTDLDDQGSDNYIYDAEGQLKVDVQSGLRYHYNGYGLVERIEKDYTPLNGIDNFVNLVKFEYGDGGQRSRKISYDNNGSAVKYTWYVRDASGAEVASYEEVLGQAVSAPDYPILADARLGNYNRANSTRVYELMDHLGNVRTTFGRDLGTNDLLVYGYTDYYPFGSPLPGRNQISSPQYEHGYQGQFTLKDEETGLDAFELRLWDSRLARWTSTDPYGQYASPYLGMGNNPISGVDPDGGWLQGASAITKAVINVGITTVGGAIVGAAIGGAIDGGDGAKRGAQYGALVGLAGGLGYYGASAINWGTVGGALKDAGGALASGAKSTFSSPSTYVAMLNGGIDGYRFNSLPMMDLPDQEWTPWKLSGEEFKNNYSYEVDFNLDENAVQRRINLDLLGNPDSYQIFNSLGEELLSGSGTHEKFININIYQDRLMGQKLTLRVTAGDVSPTAFKYRTKGLSQIGDYRIIRPVNRYKSVRLL